MRVSHEDPKICITIFLSNFKMFLDLSMILWQPEVLGYHIETPNDPFSLPTPNVVIISDPKKYSVSLYRNQKYY